MISCEERNLIILGQRETLIGLSVLSQTVVQKYTLRPLEWKRYISDIFSLWNVDGKEIEEFIVLANSRHPIIKFTAEISDEEINFLDTTVFKGERFNKQAILDIRRHLSPQKLSIKLTSLPATYQRLEKSYQRVYQRNLSSRILPNSKQASVRETTPKV